ncbi:MAG TPA: hypothetical protein DCG23_00610, partial [Deltaproteobacteria bacterium]|nr:hypothetical protein [Deltaproteobacteria bacterium]
SGAAIAFAALLLILPGFATDLVGFLIVFPLTRKLFFKKFSNYQQNSKCGKDLEIFGINNLEYQDLHREEILHW